ncbi:MAG: lipopolysaccharide biosynthesis protein [Oligoflexia bacterium]|nr:lipopolysaccharide biosynthesis protein [Oligoflexia bacterium]
MHKLTTRYSYKLLSNVITFFLGFVTAGIVPRNLGPANYGNFNFLTGFFSHFISILDCGCSSWFYVRLSQNPEQKDILRYFTLVVFIICLVFFTSIGCVFLLHQENWFWPQQKKIYILFAATYGLIVWISNICEQISDALGFTVYSEIIKISQKIIGVAVLLLLLHLSWINLKSIFIYHISITFFVLSIVCFIMYSKKKWSPSKCSSSTKDYFKDMSIYTWPLISCTIISCGANYLDRWLLQLLVGSKEQGFFSLALMTSSFCFMFSQSLTQLLIREYSIQAAKKDFENIARLFNLYLPLMYTIAAYFACFISSQSSNIVKFIGGEKYAEAMMTTAVLAFFSIFQTYGQLSGSLFLSMDKVKLYRNIGIFFSIIGVPLTYIMVAPLDKYGFGLGSLGLAIKTVVLQFFWVNTQLFFNTKILNLRFKKYLWHQFYIIGVLMSLALLAKEIVVSSIHINYIGIFIISGAIYTSLAYGFVEATHRFKWWHHQELTQIIIIINRGLAKMKSYL